MEEKLKSSAEKWNLDNAAIQRAVTLYKQDYPEGDSPSLENELLPFLYAKGILAKEKSVIRKIKFEDLLEAEEADSDELRKALDRLQAIVVIGETSPTRANLDEQFFDAFIKDHPEWAGKNSFVVFRDHKSLKGKPHALVERFQKSGLCYMHACVVVQHYLVAMSSQDKVPMLNISEYLKKYMPSESLFEHIWSNKGGDSWDFLNNILENKPKSRIISTASDASLLDFDLPEKLRAYGPGLVSGFKVTKEFALDEWQHLGEYSSETFLGRHAMVLVGYRTVNEKKRYLLQNWWKAKPYIEVDANYLFSSDAIIRFIKEPQMEMGRYPTSYETLVECDAGMDASENFTPEGNLTSLFNFRL